MNINMKKTFKISIVLGLFIFLSQAAYASTCTYTGNTVTSATLATCSLSGGDGQDCRPYGWFYKNECTVESTITSEATACYNNNMAFDGITGCTGNCLISGNCINTSGVCQAPAANTCSTLNRSANCDGTCDGPLTGYVACSASYIGSSCVLSSGVYVCLIDYSDAVGRQDSSVANTCVKQGKTLNNQCTGECSSCPKYTAPDGTCTDHPFYYDDSAGSFKGYTGSLWQIIGGAFNTIGDIITALLNPTNITSFNQLKAALQPQFVGLTSLTTYNGAQSGYKLANDKCATGAGALAGSHICMPDEIIYSYANSVGAITSLVTGTAWYNTGSPSNFVPLVSDCKGWANGTASYFGNVWNFAFQAGAVQGCDTTRAFACCK
jgi:hypothetical protein